MGDISDMILDGDLCQGCGEYIGDGDGWARYCHGCSGIRKPKEKTSLKRCSARGCDQQTPTKIYACDYHWKILPKEIKDGFKKYSKLKVQINKGLTKAQRDAQLFWRNLKWMENKK